MSFFSDLVDAFSGLFSSDSGSSGSSSGGSGGAGSSGPPPIGGGGNYQPPSTNWGNLIGGAVQVVAPLITATVNKPNKPKFPALPDSVTKDPRFQQLIGPYGGGTNAPSIEPLSPFQIAFGTMFQNAFYEPAGVPQEEKKKEDDGTIEADFTSDVLNDGPVSERDIPIPASQQPGFKFDKIAFSNVEKFGGIIGEAAAKYNLDPAVLKAIIATESSGRPDAESKIPKRSEGALGLGQLLRSTAESLAGRKLTREQVLDPVTNVNLAAQLVSQLWSKYEGDFDKVFGAYNAGEAAVDSGRYRKFKETMNYIPKVTGWLNYYRQNGRPGNR